MAVSRGVIRNRQFANQVKDFSGLRYGSITPTDIDGAIDFGNRVFVFIELKYGAGNIPCGQKLALERIADDLDCYGKPTIAIVARHDSDADIDVANCPVEQIRFRGKWILLANHHTVRYVIDRFLMRYAPWEMRK